MMKCSSSLVALAVAALNVASASADRIFETAVELSKPKKSADRVEGGANHVPLAIWLPDGVKTIRGVFFNPFYVKAVEQEHWRAACRQWGFAVVGGNYMRVHNGDFAPTLLKALKEFAEKSGHPELANAPLLVGGMSAGAGMSVAFAKALPERVIAAGPVCLEVGPQTEGAREIPMITIFGDKDGQQYRILTEKLPKQRAAFDAKWAIAPQWGRGHEYGAANNLLLPFFDEVLRQRYPADASPADGPVALRPCDPARAWLADPGLWKERVAAIDNAPRFPGEKKAAACWLPSEGVARVWQAFVVPNPVVKITSPAGLGDKQPFQVHSADGELTVKVEIAAGTTAEKIELFDLDKRIAEGAPTGQTCELNPGKLAPGVHTLIARAHLAGGATELSRPATILVQIIAP